MNRFHILKEKKGYPRIKTLHSKFFIFGMKSWQGSIIDKFTITMEIDEEAYNLLSNDASARIEIHDENSFKIWGFLVKSILSMSTFRDVENSKEMVRVTLQGTTRQIGGLL